MRNEALKSPNEDIRKLGELLEGSTTAMLTSIDADASLHARPMALLDVDDEATLWFFTRRDSAKTREVDNDEHVNVALSSESDDRYVSIRGLARLVDDEEKKGQLWNPLHRAWFPQGLEDPELALLKVEVQRVDFWDPPSSTMVQVVGFAKAILTGQTYEASPGEMGQLDLQH